MTVIAMTREMATLGKDVAAGLAERLGLEVVHHELVEHDIAAHAGMRDSEVHRYLEGEASLLERWRIDPHRLSHYTKQEILELTAKGNVLIRGWGAAYLLREVPHVICVRIWAPLSFREEVLMKRLGVGDRARARQEIERNDAAHNAVMQRMFGVDWREAEHYAMVLNTHRVPVATCIDYIAALALSREYQETESSRRALLDQAIQEKVQTALDQHFGSVLTMTLINASVENGRVILSGTTSDAHADSEAQRLAKRVEGVATVESNILYVAPLR
jgi:cytidylate kinase